MEVNWIIDEVKERLSDFFGCRAEESIILYLSKGQFLIAVKPPIAFSYLEDSDMEELNEGHDTVQITLFSQQEKNVVRVEEFGKVYEKLVEQVKESFYTGRAFRKPDESAESYKKTLCLQLPTLSEYDFNHTLKNYMNAVVTSRLNRKKVLHDCYEICCAIYDTFNYSFQNKEELKLEKHNLVLALEEFDTVDGIEKFMREFYEVQNKRANDPEKEQDDEKIVQRILCYIDEHYTEPISAESLVEEFYFSSNTIRALFKKHTDQTIHEYLSQVRMERAAEMLHNPHIKIKEIANRVGYDNVSYFCMRFSKDYGMSPLAYRKKHLNVIGRRVDD
jgi:two-component system response regulator YesN